MRKDFAKLLYQAMQEDESIWLLTGDLGFGLFDKIREDFPERYLNVGAAEQTLLDVGIGLALSGKKPICYSITPFLLYRGFETIRTYINHESIPVILVGSGRDDDYKHDGFSHYAGDDVNFMQHFKNIFTEHPETLGGLELVVEVSLKAKYPVYINLSR